VKASGPMISIGARILIDSSNEQSQNPWISRRRLSQSTMTVYSAAYRWASFTAIVSI
jgi:hypothetical protein